MTRTKQAARAQLLRVQAAAAAERRARERANIADLATFLHASAQVDEVELWLQERIDRLRVEAAERRCRHERAAGAALAAVRGRGETIEWIAAQVGMTPARLREALKVTDAVQNM